MGYTRTQEMRQFLGDDLALYDHLQFNHYPPIPLAYMPALRQAIEYARCDEWEEKVELLDGRVATVAALIAAAHLELFLAD